MEHMGWDNVIQPIVALNNGASSRSSAWSNQQQGELLQNGAAKGFTSMWANRTHPGFATPEGIIDHTANGNNEVDSITYGSGLPTDTAFYQQQPNLSSSSGSSQLSDYHVLSSNTPLIDAYFAEDHFSANGSTDTLSNAKTFPPEGDGISSNDNIVVTPMPSSSKRKSPASAAEMINFNGVSKKRKTTNQIKLTFGSNINENVLDYTSSTAEGGSSTGLSLIASCLPKSSNINFELQEISSETDAPDSENIAEMKEMIYRAAAFRPVYLGMDEVAEKPKRKNVKISSDPQTAAARQRRERISDRIRVLQRIVPGGNKMDTATMLDEAANYLKFLRSQVKALEKCLPSGSFGFSSYNFLP